MKRLAFLIVSTSIAIPAVVVAQTPEPAPAPAPDTGAGAADTAAADTAAADSPVATQSPAEQLFSEKCASCHSIGKGDRVGPDLKGAHERRDDAWLSKMIATPSALLGTDADARAMLKKYNNVRMPDLGLSGEEVSTLVELIKRCSAEECNLAGSFVAVTEALPADVERGRRLFLGVESLVAGGPPCVSCHTAAGTKAFIGGGTLAKDLTHVFARLGDEGLDGAIKNPPFPIMIDVYAKRRPDKDEAFALRAFLSASNRSTEQGDSISVFLVAVGGTAFCFFILNLLWKRRLRGVRKPMVHRGVTS